MQKITDLQDIYEKFLAHPSISTDSRKVQPGDLFFALSGPSFDGNDFALSALQSGAAYAIVSRAELAEANDRCLLVEETLMTLQKLAQYHRQQLTIPIVAITGTNGKTTTKELAHAVLSQRYDVLATEGNLNNHIGVPLTLLRLRPEHEVAIVEMGASAEGEVALLCALAAPTMGLITNIGRAHLQGFGSVEGILRAKSELPQYLTQHGGAFFLNMDDPLLREHWQGKTKQVYGSGEGRVTATLLAPEPVLRLQLAMGGDSVEVQTQLVGSYNLQNVLAAVNVAASLGVTLAQMKQALEQYHPSNSRSQLVELGQGSWLVLDAYNANPSSMMVALEGITHWSNERKVVILGDMRELGSASHQEHARIITWLEEHPSITPILVGREFEAAAKGSSLTTLPDVQALITHLQGQTIEPNTVLLLKGSRGLTLEKALPTLQDIAR